MTAGLNRPLRHPSEAAAPPKADA